MVNGISVIVTEVTVYFVFTTSVGVGVVVGLSLEHPNTDITIVSNAKFLNKIFIIVLFSPVLKRYQFLSKTKGVGQLQYTCLESPTKSLEQSNM